VRPNGFHVKRGGDPFYSSAAWRALRRRALVIAGHHCAWCGADVRARGASRVDHIRPRREAPALSLVLANLRVLCTVCDARRHAEKGQGVAGHALRKVDADGLPTSALHHWNRRQP
jgi:5-methylcytosine-specific restriction endonuclease McrA